MSDTLILTAELDLVSQVHFDNARRQYFPPAKNFLAAHVKLFHRLPIAEMASIRITLRSRCQDWQPVPFSTSDLRFLGRGVGYDLEMPEISTLRTKLAERWADWLTPQDQLKFRPHITVQNKVDPSEAKRLFDALQANYAPWHGEIIGIAIHLYMGGPWKRLGAENFCNARRLDVVPPERF